VARSPDTVKQENYLELVIREFRRTKSLADGAMAQCSDEEFFAIPGRGDNSIAIIAKHVAGNLVSRWTDFLTSDGEKPDRDRDTEFEIGPEDDRARLMAFWERGWYALFAALAPLSEADLSREIRICGESLSVLQAINRQLTHYSYHVGQIVYVAKHLRGDSWRTLSIPRKGSAQFNQRPAAYLGSGAGVPGR
jgi:hypothetical protein